MKNSVNPDRTSPTAISFKLDVLEQIEAVRGNLSLSVYVNNVIDKITKEQKKGISN